MIKNLNSEWVDAVLQNQLFTCFWIVTSSTSFDNMFVIGIVIVDHFNQFGYLTGGSKARQSIMSKIWFSFVWVIWKERNTRTFSKNEDYIHHLSNKVKLLSYMWLKAKYINLTFGIIAGGLALSLVVHSLTTLFLLFSFWFPWLPFVRLWCFPQVYPVLGKMFIIVSIFHFALLKK